MFLFFRPGFEITSDDPENYLQHELVELYQTKVELTNKISQCKSTYNILENQRVLTSIDLENKTHSLDIDIKCMDTRNKLRVDILFNPALSLSIGNQS